MLVTLPFCVRGVVDESLCVMYDMAFWGEQSHGTKVTVLFILTFVFRRQRLWHGLRNIPARRQVMQLQMGCMLSHFSIFVSSVLIDISSVNVGSRNSMVLLQASLGRSEVCFAHVDKNCTDLRQNCNTLYGGVVVR